MHKFSGFLKHALIWFALTSLVQAVPAVTVTPPDLFGPRTGNDVTIGWEFSTNSAITVTSLGFFDDLQDGLLQSHEVGIFSAGTLLASAIIPAGTGATLINQFRWVAIAPLGLSAGQTFRIGAYLPSLPLSTPRDSFMFDPTGFASAPEINFVGRRFLFGGFGDPNAGTSQPGAFGPNFDFVAAATGVPEINGHLGNPLAIALLWLGIMASRRCSSRLKTAGPCECA